MGRHKVGLLTTHQPDSSAEHEDKAVVLGYGEYYYQWAASLVIYGWEQITRTSQ